MRYSKKLYIVLLICSMFATYIRAQSVVKEIHIQEQEIANLYIERIQRVVDSIIGDARTLRDIFTLFPEEMTQERFDSIARIIFESKYYTFISYQPDGLVKYMFPRKMYDWILGMDVLQDKFTSQDALFAMKSGRTVLTGPYKNENLEAMVVRHPVFEFEKNKRKFWGFVSIGFDVNKLLAETIKMQALPTFSYEFALFVIYQENPVLIMESENFVMKEEDKYIFSAGDQTWSLYVYDKRIRDDVSLTILIYLGFYVILSTAMYVVIRKFELKQINAKKLSYMDTLTSAYNRKIVDEYFLQYPQEAAGGFTLFYMDLNDFKPVNDIHGHDMGDKLLIAFVDRVVHNFSSDTIVARMGGDEFVIILPKCLDDIGLQSVIKRIDDLAKTKFTLAGVELQISASIGYGQYAQDGSADGTCMAEILAIADERMYAWKKELKARRAAQAGC